MEFRDDIIVKAIMSSCKYQYVQILKKTCKKLPTCKTQGLF